MALPWAWPGVWAGTACGRVDDPRVLWVEGSKCQGSRLPRNCEARGRVQARKVV